MNAATFIDTLAFHQFMQHGVKPIVAWWLVWVQEG